MQLNAGKTDARMLCGLLIGCLVLFAVVIPAATAQQAKEQQTEVVRFTSRIGRARKLYRTGYLLDARKTLHPVMERFAVRGERKQFQDAARLYFLTCRDGDWLGTYLSTFRKLSKAKKLPEERHRMVVFRLAHGLASAGKTKQAKKHLPELPEGGPQSADTFEDAHELCVYAETGMCEKLAKAYRYAGDQFEKNGNWREVVWAGRSLYDSLDTSTNDEQKARLLQRICSAALRSRLPQTILSSFSFLGKQWVSAKRQEGDLQWLGSVWDAFPARSTDDRQRLLALAAAGVLQGVSGKGGGADVSPAVGILLGEFMDKLGQTTDLRSFRAVAEREGDVPPKLVFKARNELLEIGVAAPHPAKINVAHWLAWMHKKDGDYAKGKELYKQVVRAYKTAFGADNTRRANALAQLAALYKDQGDYAKAEPLYKRALKIREKTLGPEDPSTAASLHNLALVYQDKGDYAKAEPLYKRALKIMKKTLGPEHFRTATSLNNLAMAYEAKGDYAKAEPLYKRALKIRKKALGPEHPRTVTTINNLALLYGATGDYAKAEPLFKRALKIREKTLGPEHPRTATSLTSLAMVYQSKGDYAKAEPLYKRALNIYEKTLGSEHPRTATSLNNLAVLYRAKGDYAKAEPLQKRALRIREKALGLEHPSTANSLNNLAELYRSKGDYAKAEPLYERALKIDEKTLGPEHPSTATSLGNLAGLYYRKGNYAKAEPLFKRALKIREKTLGPEHPDTAGSLNNLAQFYRKKGDYAKAEPLYKRALKIREKALGPEHPDTAGSLNNLAGLYEAKGNYAKAEPLFKRALKIREKTLGPEHPYTADSLNNLALLYAARGDYTKAEPLYKRALKIFEKALGSEHPRTATSLNNLANLYQNKGDYAKAEPLLKRALKIDEKTLGPEHPHVAMSLNNLASLYQDKGDYAKAELHFQRALKVFEQVLGSEHPSTATSLNNLAGLYHQKGDYAKAEPLLKRALKIRKKALGSDHPRTAGSLNNLALLECAVGNIAKALRLSRRGAQAQAAVRENVFASSSQQERMLFMDKQFNYPRTIMLTLASRDSELQDEARRAAALWTLRGKRRVLDSILEDLMRLRDNPEAKKVLERLRTVKKTLSALMLKPTGGMEKKAIRERKKRIQQLQNKREMLEKRLARMAGRYREGRRASNVSLKQVRRRIPKNAVLVEFVRFTPIATAEQRAEKNLEGGSLKRVYSALVIGPKKQDLSLVRLGKAEKIDTLLRRYQKAMEKGEPVFDLAKKLYRELWRPMEKELDGKQQVILSPAGRLNFLSFATLVGPKGRYLAETHRIGYVGSGRDLVRRVETKAHGASLFGDPAFGTEKESDSDFLSRQGSYHSSLRGQDRSLLSQMQFSPLPGTKKEVEAIAKLAQGHDKEVTTLLETEASEAELKSLRKPRLLHLATHGFFLPDVEVPEQKGPQPMQMAQTAGTRGGGGMATISAAGPAMVENPMHRSGLALAGASKLGEDVEDKEGSAGEDGIVTAEEVGTLDLWGTQLVVLSACETGLGEVAGGEGVMGLRRAFVQAGAKNLVLSLWPVDDEATANLMEQFYRRYLETGDAVGAMRCTQREVIETARESGKKIHPNKWGAFVVSFQGMAQKGTERE